MTGPRRVLRRASGTTMRSASWRASGTTSARGADE